MYIEKEEEWGVGKAVTRELLMGRHENLKCVRGTYFRNVYEERILEGHNLDLLNDDCLN